MGRECCRWAIVSNEEICSSGFNPCDYWSFDCPNLAPESPTISRLASELNSGKVQDT